MNQALYRKYRSKSFEEVVGQEHVTKTLQNALKRGRISHAYLFTGPRGVGKTSVARILAHEVNQISYTGETVHLDIIEIDAASNRRIDEIRELRERVRVAPAAAKYKVYIIDEVHMLTREAFNALLKTLEEPPAHCIFILATTEAHKLPETIVSRTQRFEFKPIGPSHTVEHLKNIAKKEKIAIKNEALALLAEFGNGSFRDSIGYLDQLSSLGEEIDEDDVRSILGQPSKSEIELLIKGVNSGNSIQALETLQNLKDQGLDAVSIAAAVSKELRRQIISGAGNSNFTVLLKSLLDVPASTQPFDLLEINLLEACSTVSRINTPSENKRGGEEVPSQESIDKNSKHSQIKPKQNDKILDSKKVLSFSEENWEEFITTVKSRAASLYTALRLAKPIFESDEVILKFQFPLHQKKVDQTKNKALIAELIEEMTGSKVKISCLVDKQSFETKKAILNELEISKEDTSIHSINNIFGAAEVLET